MRSAGGTLRCALCAVATPRAVRGERGRLVAFIQVEALERVGAQSHLINRKILSAAYRSSFIETTDFTKPGQITNSHRSTQRHAYIF